MLVPGMARGEGSGESPPLLTESQSTTKNYDVMMKSTMRQ